MALVSLEERRRVFKTSPTEKTAGLLLRAAQRDFRHELISTTDFEDEIELVADWLCRAKATD